MKYFMIESTFRNPLPVSEAELQRLLQEHLGHLSPGFAAGWILISGPKASGGGGVIVMKAASLAEAEAFFAEDPMKKAGVQDYAVVEFKLHDCQAALKEWFD